LAAATLLFTVVRPAPVHASGPTTNTPFQHVIVIVQENRTPDNLFGSNHSFESGVNVRTWGLDSNNNQVNLQPRPLSDCYNPYHDHDAFQDMYNAGAMNGADTIGISIYAGCTLPADSEFVYVDSNQTYNAQPYFDIATRWGFANFMFQSNQGPSFPAHQFLLSGTSAPTWKGNPYDDQNKLWWQWFDADNDYVHTPYGCLAQQGTFAPQVDYLGNYYLDCSHPPKGSQGCYVPPVPPYPPYVGPAFPCFEHPTMTDLLDSNGFNGQNQISWEYYGLDETDIWDAPDAILHTCVPSTSAPGCTGSHFIQGNGNQTGLVYLGNPAQIFNDIDSCHLANVSWVIPNGAWSDHAGGYKDRGNQGYGPSWVADIVNEIGNNTNCDTNTWNGKTGYWYDTAILITWDDWGGYYDHVLPLNCPSGQGRICTGYPTGDQNSSGWEYVYSFRVPLLVVSAYKGPYVSGPVSDPNTAATCLNNASFPCHDFGSILNFTEYVFGSNGSGLGWPYGIGGQWNIGQNYPYADYWAPDGPNVPNAYAKYSLSDFFDFNTYGYNPLPFGGNISAPKSKDFFLGWGGGITDPDDD
jgi:hypothetical protein